MSLFIFFTHILCLLVLAFARRALHELLTSSTRDLHETFTSTSLRVRHKLKAFGRQTTETKLSIEYSNAPALIRRREFIVDDYYFQYIEIYICQEFEIMFQLMM